MSNVKKVVKTDAAPGALGPYSQAIVAGGLVYCAGQIPLDPATGQIVSGGVAPQTAQVLKNLRAVLKAAGSDLDRAVKTTVFIKDKMVLVEMCTLVETLACCSLSPKDLKAIVRFLHRVNTKVRRYPLSPFQHSLMA